jgi:hypothetical protein
MVTKVRTVLLLIVEGEMREAGGGWFCNGAIILVSDGYTCVLSL